MKGRLWGYGDAKKATSPGGTLAALNYSGRAVQTETRVIAGLNARGKRGMEAVIETTAQAGRDFRQGGRGAVPVPWEEGTQAAGLSALLRPVVAKGGVCAPRKNPW